MMDKIKQSKPWKSGKNSILGKGKYSIFKQKTHYIENVQSNYMIPNYNLKIHRLAAVYIFYRLAAEASGPKGGYLCHSASLT